MHTNTDARVQKTKETLRRALLSCMEEAAFRDIRVKDLCERAGINKTTLYKYYADLSALAEEVEREQLKEFAAVLSQREKSGEALLREILRSVDRAKLLYHTENGGLFSESFRTGLLLTARTYGMQAWKELLPRMAAREAELTYTALLAGALQVATEADGTEDREKVIFIIMDMFRSYIKTHREETPGKTGTEV